MDSDTLKHVLEASLLVAGRALSLAQLDALFEDDGSRPERKAIRAALEGLQQEYEGRGIELVEVSSGFRLQSRVSMEPWISRLFPERAPRYSRALLETLVLIAYRQPITRGEIEEVRGVAVSSTIVKTLQERDWVKVIGHKEVPGRPALLATTREFLDYFNLKRLEDLPPLSELKDLDQIDSKLAEEIGLVTPGMQGDAANDGPEVYGPPAPPWAQHAAENDELQTDTAAESGVAGLESGDQPADADAPDLQTPDEPESAAMAADSPAQTELQRVIANFALEHRQQLEQQRAQATGEPSDTVEQQRAGLADESFDAPVREGADPADEASDTPEPQDARSAMEPPTAAGNREDLDATIDTGGRDSQDDSSDRHTSDRPGPGDTLH